MDPTREIAFGSSALRSSRGLNHNTDTVGIVCIKLMSGLRRPGERPPSAVRLPCAAPRARSVRATTAGMPTLHVYLQPPTDLKAPYPLVYLSRLEALTAVAQRPTRQSAVSLPFGDFSVGWPSPRMAFPLFEAGELYRWPAALIKLYFPFDALGRPDITAEGLFPKEEPLYRRLLKLRVPYLAIYA
jgi:hypothetical protein